MRTGCRRRRARRRTACASWRPRVRRCRRRDAAGGSSDAEIAAAEKERESLANDRQQMSNDLEKLQKGMRDTARELAPTQPGAASSLRDALSGMDQADLTNLVQRTADWLRSGINPNSNGTETQIATGLKKLDDQVRQAQQAAGGGPNGRQGQDPGTQTAALGQVDRLRSQIESLSPGRGAPNGRNGQQPGQKGEWHSKVKTVSRARATGTAGQQGRTGQAGHRGNRGKGSRADSRGKGSRVRDSRDRDNAARAAGWAERAGRPGWSRRQGQGSRGNSGQFGGEQIGQAGRQGGQVGQRGQPMAGAMQWPVARAAGAARRRI